MENANTVSNIVNDANVFSVSIEGNLSQGTKTASVSPFMTEKDTFDVSVDYKRSGSKIYVKTIDENYDLVSGQESQVTMTLKYPSQGDTTLISMQIKNSSQQKGDLDLRDYLAVEVYRLAVLVRGWNLGVELNNENLYAIHPKIIKSILNKIREEISTDGIL